MKIKIPKTHPVQPLKPGQQAKQWAQCGTCHLTWDDGISTSMTPVPSGRCPFEYYHVTPKEKPSVRTLENAHYLIKALLDGLKYAHQSDDPSFIHKRVMPNCADCVAIAGAEAYLKENKING